MGLGEATNGDPFEHGERTVAAAVRELVCAVGDIAKPAEMAGGKDEEDDEKKEIGCGEDLVTQD